MILFGSLAVLKIYSCLWPGWTDPAKKAKKTLRCMHAPQWYRNERYVNKLREVVTGSDRVGQAAGRAGTNRGAAIGTTGRTRRNAADGVQLDVGRQVRGKGDGIPSGPMLFERELIGRRVDLAEVVDTRIGL